MKSKLYFSAILISLFIAETAAAQYEKEVWDLLQRAELKAPEWEKLNKLGKHSIVSLTLLLEKEDVGFDIPVAIAIMGRQYKLYEKDLSESERQRALEMMVAKSRSLKDTPLLMVLNSFKGIDSEEIRKFALEYQDDQNELIRTVANSLLISKTKQSPTQDELPKSQAGPEANPPPPLPNSENLNLSRPQATNAPSPSSTQWSIIVMLTVAVIGLLWLMLKNRK